MALFGPSWRGAGERRTRMAPLAELPGDRLESWKEIAAYLKRGVRTVRRWEHDEGLPVHRHVHRVLGSVYAYRSEIDAWRKTSPRRLSGRPAPTSGEAATSIAVLPFTNLSADPDNAYFADGLTDEVSAARSRVRALRLADLGDDVPGIDARRQDDRGEARRAVRSRRQRAAVGRTAAHHRAPDRRGDRHSSLGRDIRRHPRRHLRFPGTPRASDRRRAAAPSHGGRRAAPGRAAHREHPGIRVLPARAPGTMALAQGCDRSCRATAPPRDRDRRRQPGAVRGARPRAPPVPGSGRRFQRRSAAGRGSLRAKGFSTRGRRQPWSCARGSTTRTDASRTRSACSKKRSNSIRTAPTRWRC